MSDKDNSRRIGKLEEMVSLLRRGIIPANELRLGGGSDAVSLVFMVGQEETGVWELPTLSVDMTKVGSGKPTLVYTDRDAVTVQMATVADTEYQQRYILLMS